MRADPTTGELLALDPSIRSAGVALFRGGVLVAADNVKCDVLRGDNGKPIEESDAARVQRMAAEIAEWVARHQAAPRVLVTEWPQIYDRSHMNAKQRNVDQNDQFGMAGVVGAVIGILSLVAAARDAALEVVTAAEVVADLEVISATPAEWMGGQVKKATTVKAAKTSARALRIQERLSGDELLIWEAVKSHDAIDAVGIGLWAIGRFERKRVYPGATE